MKKIKTITVAGVLAVATLTSCSVNDPINEAQKNREVNFSAGIAEATPVQPTRAVGNAWAVGDAVGIFMAQGSTALAENRQYQVNFAGVTAAFSAVTDADKLFYPQSGTVNFFAYYPYRPGYTLTTAIPVEIGDQTDQEDFDLMYATADNGTTGYDKNYAGTVALTFGHQLSKLIMNVTAGEGLSRSDLAGMTVTIKGMNTRSTFDLATGSLGVAGTVDDITPRTLTDGSNYDAIILPSAAIATDGAYSVEFIVDPQGEAEPFVWEMKAGTDFKGGYQYTYNVTLARSGVSAVGQITPWINQDRGPVTAE